MATITGFTAERMLIIENASVVDGDVIGDNLILTRKDGSTINAGSVRGPVGSPGVTSGELASQMAIGCPIGSMVDYIGIIAPTNWLTMMGQTIVNGQTLYPALWAAIPVGMKSGSSIVMPDTRGRVSAGYNAADTDFDTIGEIGGAKTHTLNQGELPAVPISIDPPSTSISIDPPSTNISIDPPSTSITINPPNTTSGGMSANHTHTGGGTTSTNGRHTHAQYVTADVGAGGPGVRTDMNLDVASASFFDQGITTSYDEGHLHGFLFTSDNASAGHTHEVDIAAFSATVDILAFGATVDILAFPATVDIATFNSGNIGSGQAHNILQPYVVFLKIIRAL